MRKFLCCITAILLLLPIMFSQKLSAQTVYPDFGMWNTLSVEKKINKKLSLSIDEEFRLKENLSKINLFYTNLGVNYKLSKKLRASLIYRNTQKAMDDRGYDIKHRIMLDFVYKEKLSKKFVFQFRQRFQFENNNIYSSRDGRYIESFLRSKFELGYNYSKDLKAYLSEELRFQLHDPRNPESDYGLHRFRTAMGIDYSLNSSHTVGIYYLIQNEIAVYKPNELFIMGLQYGFQF